MTKKEQEARYKNQIELLHEVVKIKLAPSAIHGVGVFALRDINKGEKLYTDAIPHQLDLPYRKFKHLDPQIREILLGHFPLIVDGSHFMYPVTKMSAYLNHSDTPNYDAKSDKALKKIRAGEEITEDYRQIEGWEQVFPFLTK
jgi:SET domain-containing protein